MHIADFDQLKLAAAEISPLAEKLMKAFWPGPFTAVLKKRSTTFVVSDFDMPADEDERLSKVLGLASRKHDMVAIKVYDRRDAELPDMGLVEMVDSESGQRVWVDTSSRSVREQYAREWQERHEAADKILSRARVDHADVTTEEDYVKELIKLFKRR